MAKVFNLLWTLLVLFWQCLIGYTQPTTVLPAYNVTFNLTNNETDLITANSTEITEPTGSSTSTPTGIPTGIPTPIPTPTPVAATTEAGCTDKLIQTTIENYIISYQGTKKLIRWQTHGCAAFDNEYKLISNITVAVTNLLLASEKCGFTELFLHSNYMQLVNCSDKQAVTTQMPSSSGHNNPTPTSKPSGDPSAAPTVSPTVDPTPIPTPNPADNQTPNPSPNPSNPTIMPSRTPTVSPLNDTYLDINGTISMPQTTVPHLWLPTMHPSNLPTPAPTSPTVSPSNEPTDSPSQSTSDPTSDPTIQPTVSPFYWGNFTTTVNGTMYQIQPNNADFTQSMIIMAVIIIGLCFLGAYCNRARLNFEKSEEKKQKAPTKLKRKRQGFSQLENSESRSAKSKKRGYNNYADSSDEDSNNNDDDPSSPIDDTMVSQTIALDESQKKKKKQKQRHRGIKNGLMTRHRTEKTDKIKFDQLNNDDENDNEDDNEAYASDTSELNDDGMGNNQGAKRRHHKKRKHRRDRERDRNGKGGDGDGDVNVDVDEDDDDFDSDGNGGVRIIPNPYAKNRKPKGLAGVLGEKFETLKSSVNQSVSKLNARKENVVVIPMGPVGASANQKQSQRQQKQQQRDKPKRKKKKEIRDYGRVGSGIRRKKSKQDNESSSKRKVTKQRSESSGTQSSSGDDHDGDNNNGHGSGNGKKKDDVFKICENDNVSDDYNITDSDGSSSNSSDGAIAVRLNKFGRGIKQPITVASVTNKGKSKRKSDSKDSSNNSGVTHGNGVPKSSS